MADIVTAEKRSQMMAGIRGKNTKPEIILRRRLHRLGYRYRIHVGSLPGSPDLVLPKWNAVIFIHGCFWHGHDCSLFKLPQTRREFWEEKIGKNRARDSKVLGQLTDEGWRVLTVWECAIRGLHQLGPDEVVAAIGVWLKGGADSGEIRARE